MLNLKFLFKNLIVDNIILNYNPFVLNKGIPLFKGNYFENKLGFIVGNPKRMLSFVATNKR